LLSHFLNSDIKTTSSNNTNLAQNKTHDIITMSLSHPNYLT